MHLVLKKGTKFPITLAILEEFLVNSLFYKTFISMVDMKILVYSNFSKNKFWEKMNSPSSMRNGRFHPSKCRGKVQKQERKLSKGFS
jgi:hypothetical protein